MFAVISVLDYAHNSQKSRFGVEDRRTHTHTHTRIVRQTPVQTRSVNEPSLSLPLLHTVSTYVHTVCVACGYLCCVCRSVCVCALFIAAQPARERLTWLVVKRNVLGENAKGHQAAETRCLSKLLFFFSFSFCSVISASRFCCCLCGSVWLSVSVPNLPHLAWEGETILSADVPFDVYVSVCPCVIMCRGKQCWDGNFQRNSAVLILSSLVLLFASLFEKKLGRKELLTGNNQICERKQIKRANRQKTITKLTNHL